MTMMNNERCKRQVADFASLVQEISYTTIMYPIALCVSLGDEKIRHPFTFTLINTDIHLPSKYLS